MSERNTDTKKKDRKNQMQSDSAKKKDKTTKRERIVLLFAHNILMVLQVDQKNDWIK